MKGVTPTVAVCVLALTLTGFTPAAVASSATGSIPVGQSASQVLSSLTVGTKSSASSDRKSHP